MPDKDEKGLTELDWKAVLYGEALSDKTLKAGRNLALVAVATLSVSVFNLTMTAVPTLAIDFSKQPAALEMFLADVYTISANLAGIPGLSIPCGLGSGPLPIGLQLLGPAFSEATLLRIARMYERHTDWGMEPPGL